MSKHLEVPPDLERIYKVRDRLVNGHTDRDDHVAVTYEWEKKVKTALITLSLKKHEGVHIVLKKAAEELRDIEEVLKNQRPKDLSPDEAQRFAYETMRLNDRRDLWLWFMGLFAESQTDLQSVREEVALEFEGEEDNPAEDLDEDLGDER